MSILNDLQIEILYFTAPSKKKFAFRIFKDMLNRYFINVLTVKENTFTLPLNYYDLAIVVDSPDGLDEPKRQSFWYNFYRW